MHEHEHYALRATTPTLNNQHLIQKLVKRMF